MAKIKLWEGISLTRKSKTNSTNSVQKVYFKPKTVGQSEYVRSIAENIVTCCTSPAGCGKSYISVGMALQYLFEGKIDKILFCRPMVNCGDGLGWLKGGLEDKYFIYITPLFEEAIKLTSKQIIDDLIANKIIQVIPLELLRGMNFHRTFMCLDECQNASYNQIKLFLTRIGEGSKTVLTGDLDQSDINDCAFENVINKLENTEDIGIVRLTTKDIVRSDIVGKILMKL